MYESEMVASPTSGATGAGCRYPWEGVPAGPALAAVLLPVEVDSLDSAAAASWAAASQRLDAHVEARRYAALARYGANTRFQPDPGAPTGADKPVSPGGQGTPPVSEFGMIDLGIALGSTTGRAFNLLADALDLAYRMPRLFARLAAGKVPGYKVRMILKAARWLSLEAAGELDEHIAARASGIGPKRLHDLVQQIAMRLDPDAAAARASAAKKSRHVSLGDAEDGLRYLSGTVDTFAGLAFDAALDAIADILADLGAAGSKDERRADALGWLANPVAALGLLERHRAWQHAQQHTSDRDGQPPDTEPATHPDTDPDTEPAPDLGSDDADADGTVAQHDRWRPGLWPMDQPTPQRLVDPALWPSVELVIHISRQEWLTGLGAAYLDGHGPITAAQALTAVGHTHVTITPVVDLEDTPISNADEFAGRVREAVLLANPFTPFPYADGRARPDDDIDHTIPRSRGGPTSLGNGGPLRRRQHRFKTHHSWRVKQPFPGIFVWRSPQGQIYVCDRRGDTYDLDAAA